MAVRPRASRSPARRTPGSSRAGRAAWRRTRRRRSRRRGRGGTEPIRENLLDLVREGERTGELAVEDPTFTVDFLLHGLHGVLEGLFAEGVVAEGAAVEGVAARVDGVLTALLNPTEPAG
ncbi:hypothetical protein [Plantactinospora sp. B5E13]|uniref:hypothetical protein n=1 Tax=unclassified Plantactinospora TaxID=2631981 RepID=UPI00325DC477